MFSIKDSKSEKLEKALQNQIDAVADKAVCFWVDGHVTGVGNLLDADKDVHKNLREGVRFCCIVAQREIFENRRFQTEKMLYFDCMI